MKEVTDYILTHYKEAITRETLASLAGLSPSHFSHVFKRRTGKSPIEYLTDIRIRRAKELLVTSNKCLKEIAETVGYRDEFYFSRMFKEEEAVMCLKKYDLKAAQAAEKLQSHFKQNETVMILRIYDNHFALYGNRNIGGVLYDDLGLNPMGGGSILEVFSKPIDLHEIIDGQPDHLFILRAQDSSSKNLYHKLVKHRGWYQLPAVLKNQVCYIKIYPWLKYSATAHNMIIDEITQLFSNKN